MRIGKLHLDSPEALPMSGRRNMAGHQNMAAWRPRGCHLQNAWIGVLVVRISRNCPGCPARPQTR